MPNKAPALPHRLENTKTGDRQIRFLIYHLEIASRLADQSGKRSSSVHPSALHGRLGAWPCVAQPLQPAPPTPHPLRCTHAAGVGKMCWLLDFTDYSLSNAPPLKVSIHCNNILQHHYPERLGMAVCYHAPTLFTLTWKVREGGAGRQQRVGSSIKPAGLAKQA